jgi:hypothetical protein
MPTVQLYGPRKQLTEALPGVRKSAAETPLSTGVGVSMAQADATRAQAELGGDVTRLGVVMGREAIEQRREATAARDAAEEVSAWESEIRLGRWENQRLWDPDTGAMHVKGKDAQPLPGVVGAEFDQQVESIASGISSEKARDSFRKRAANRGLQLDLKLLQHSAGEAQAHELGTLNALLAIKQEEAIRNAPDGITQDGLAAGLALKDAVDAMTAAGPRLGLSPEELQDKVSDIRTATHVGIVNTLLAQNKPRAAADYFRTNADQIRDGKVKDGVRANLEEGTDLAEAQHAADSILAAGGTLAEQRAKARAFEGKKRQNVLQILEHEDAVTDAATRESDKQFFDTVYATVERTHQLPDALTRTRLGTALPGVLAFQKSLIAQTPIQTDLQRWYALVELSHTDPGAFVKTNLWLDRSRLGDEEFKQLGLMQASVANRDATGRAAGQTVPDGIRTNEQIVLNTLEQYGLNVKAEPGSQEHDAILRLRRMLDRQVDAVQGLPGPDGKLKKLTNTEIQQQLDEILKVKTSVKGSWWNVWPMPGYFFDTDLKMQQIRPQDIPATDRQQILDSFKRRGLEASEPQILDTYLQGLLNKRRPAPAPGP